MSKSDQLAHIEERCQSIERDLHSLRKSVLGDFGDSLCDISSLRKEINMAVKFLTEQVQLQPELKDISFKFFSTYTQCDDLAASLQRTLDRVSKRLVRGLAISEQNVEIMRQISQSAALLDTDKFDSHWMTEVEIEKPSQFVLSKKKCDDDPDED